MNRGHTAYNYPAPNFENRNYNERVLGPHKEISESEYSWSAMPRPEYLIDAGDIQLYPQTIG